MPVRKDILSAQAISPDQEAVAAVIAILEERLLAVIGENERHELPAQLETAGMNVVNDNPAQEIALESFTRVSGRLP